MFFVASLEFLRPPLLTNNFAADTGGITAGNSAEKAPPKLMKLFWRLQSPFPHVSGRSSAPFPRHSSFSLFCHKTFKAPTRTHCHD